VLKAQSEAYKARAQVMVSLLAAKCSPTSALKMSRTTVPSPTAPRMSAAIISQAPSSFAPPRATDLNRASSVVTVSSPERSSHVNEDNESLSGAARMSAKHHVCHHCYLSHLLLAQKLLGRSFSWPCSLSPSQSMMSELEPLIKV
jgi:hypothetical protein